MPASWSKYICSISQFELGRVPGSGAIFVGKIVRGRGSRAVFGTENKSPGGNISL